MKRLSSLILLGCMPAVGFGCELEDISYTVFHNSSYIDFVQTKQIEALSRPLTSTGKIWLSPNDELVWQTLVPLKSTLVISVNGLKQYNKNDVLQAEMNLPVALDLANIFLDILKSNYSSLEESFSSSLNCDNENWQLDLQPLDSQVSNFLTSISINGGDILEGISFQEVRGDITKIILSEPRFDSEMNFEVYLEAYFED